MDPSVERGMRRTIKRYGLERVVRELAFADGSECDEESQLWLELLRVRHYELSELAITKLTKERDELQQRIDRVIAILTDGSGA